MTWIVYLHPKHGVRATNKRSKRLREAVAYARVAVNRLGKPYVALYRGPLTVTFDLQGYSDLEALAADLILMTKALGCSELWPKVLSVAKRLVSVRA